MAGKVPAGILAARLAADPDGDCWASVASNLLEVRPATSSVVREIRTGASYAGLAYRRDGADRIVAAGGGAVSLVDAATEQVLASVDTDEFPADVVLSPEGAFAYLSHDVNVLLELPVGDGEVLRSLAYAARPGLIRNSGGLAIHPDGTELLVTSTASPGWWPRTAPPSRSTDGWRSTERPRMWRWRATVESPSSP